MQTEPEIIYDSMSVDFSKFDWSKGYYNHILTQKEIEKPYLISVQYYGEILFEDIILLLNNISDIFECVPGSQLKIPKLNDLKLFLLQNSK